MKLRPINKGMITPIMPNIDTHGRSNIGIPKYNPYEVTSFGKMQITQD